MMERKKLLRRILHVPAAAGVQFCMVLQWQGCCNVLLQRCSGGVCATQLPVDGSKVGISFAVHFLHTLKTIGHTTSATPIEGAGLRPYPKGGFFLSLLLSRIECLLERSHRGVS